MTGETRGQGHRRQRWHTGPRRGRSPGRSSPMVLPAWSSPGAVRTEARRWQPSSPAWARRPLFVEADMDGSALRRAP